MGGVPRSSVTLFLAGDVMTGRGVDQILPHPGEATLWESYLTDARQYVALAEQRNGPVPRPVDPTWPWGDALTILDRTAPAVRVINLETSLTRHGEPAPGKQVHYRMTPENLPCLTAARPDLCVLANNHTLDFGPRGLTDTLTALAVAGVPTAGAGRDLAEATRPAIVTTGPGSRLLVYGCATGSSGVPADWAATPERPGVHRLPDCSPATADPLTARIQRDRRPGDLVLVSIHWGSNWGYEVPAAHRTFAHRLIDGGVDVVHGHSSHHPRPVEVYRGRLILYGCGDLINDYEGIGGYEQFRDDLRLLYFGTFDPAGRLLRCWLVPLQARRLRLTSATSVDAAGVADVLDRISRPFGSRVTPTDRPPPGELELHWGQAAPNGFGA